MLKIPFRENDGTDFGVFLSQPCAVILMNTRGLMKLIALNIGYDLGILSAEIFAMMVLMALATTFMTGPILSLIETRNQRTALAKPDTNAAS